MESSKTIISDESLVKDDSFDVDRNRFIGGAAILGVSGISAIVAGFITSYVAKKRNKEFLKELGKEVTPQVVLESPYSLAFRALAWGTVWAVGGCSLIVFGVWKWYDIKSLNDLRMRMRNSIKKSPPTNQRTEFKDLNDLINYLNETSEKKTKNT